MQHSHTFVCKCKSNRSIVKDSIIVHLPLLQIVCSNNASSIESFIKSFPSIDDQGLSSIEPEDSIADKQ